jgi:hypothetical protein
LWLGLWVIQRTIITSRAGTGEQWRSARPPEAGSRRPRARRSPMSTRLNVALSSDARRSAVGGLHTALPEGLDLDRSPLRRSVSSSTASPSPSTASSWWDRSRWPETRARRVGWLPRECARRSEPPRQSAKPRVAHRPQSADHPRQLEGAAEKAVRTIFGDTAFAQRNRPGISLSTLSDHDRPWAHTILRRAYQAIKLKTAAATA